MAGGLAWEEDGRQWVRKRLRSDELAELEPLFGDGRPGVRLSVFDPALTATRAWDRLLAVAREHAPGCRPVRVVAFDKTDQSNWALPWHQDRVIAVREKHDVAGFSAWSRKDGVWHCEPPVSLLERMMFMRVHIDRCDEASGCLELALATHRLGRVSAGDAAKLAEEADREMCAAAPGDLLIVQALTLHRSVASRVGLRRRALRIDFSADVLPAPLEWAS